MKKSILACLVVLLFASCAQQPTAQNPTCSPPPKEGSQVVGQQTRTVKVCRDVVVQETWVKHTRILSPKPSSIPSTKSRSTTTSAPAVKKASPPTTVAPATPPKEAVVTNGGCKPPCGSGVTNGGNMIVNSPGASISDAPSEKKVEIVVPPPIEKDKIEPLVEPEKMGTTVFEAPWAK